MITKQEYIDALNRMEVSYYNFDNCMSAMNKFKEDVNLLAGLVNDHFEEKQDEKKETNFEHYKDLILECCIDNLAVVKGIPKSCSKIDCNDCDFLTIQKDCHEIAKDWLKQPHIKTTYKLTKFEIDLLQINSIKAFRFKNINALTLMKEKGYFKDVDEDATIEEILAKCEVVE